MKAYLIEKYCNMGNAYTCRRIMEESRFAGIDIKMLGIYDTCIENNKIVCKGRTLDSVDFIIHRYKYGILKDKINDLAIKSFNSLMPLNRYINKANEMIDLANISSALPIPSYILGKVNSMTFEEITDRIGSPFVVKGLLGSCGSEIYLVHNKIEFQKICKIYQNSTDELLVQKFISTSQGKDLRIFVLNGRAVAGMKRTASVGFRANVALGGQVEKIEITEEIQNMAQKITQITGLHYFGLDLLFGKESLLFCEINVTPGMEGIEEATNQNIAGLFIDSILQVIKQGEELL